MAIGSVIIIFGTLVQATAVGIGQFMAGRFFVGFGVSIITTAAPAYVVEMAHPAWRGAFTGGYNICTLFVISLIQVGISVPRWLLGMLMGRMLVFILH